MRLVLTITLCASGDRVGICSRNYIEYLVAFWACRKSPGLQAESIVVSNFCTRSYRCCDGHAERVSSHVAELRFLTYHISDSYTKMALP